MVHFTPSDFVKSECMKTSTGSWHNSLQTSICRADYDEFAPNSKKTLDKPSYCSDEGDDEMGPLWICSFFFSSPRQHKLLWFSMIISSCCCVQLKSPLWLDSLAFTSNVLSSNHFRGRLFCLPFMPTRLLLLPVTTLYWSCWAQAPPPKSGRKRVCD